MTFTLVQAIAAIATRELAIVDKKTLWHLVSCAYNHGDVSIGRAAELLGLPIAAAQRALAEAPKCCPTPEDPSHDQ